jgi:hypothetical protein
VKRLPYYVLTLAIALTILLIPWLVVSAIRAAAKHIETGTERSVIRRPSYQDFRIPPPTR